MAQREPVGSCELSKISSYVSNPLDWILMHVCDQHVKGLRRTLGSAVFTLNQLCFPPAPGPCPGLRLALQASYRLLELPDLSAQQPRSPVCSVPFQLPAPHCMAYSWYVLSGLP